jgi:hypothetical protein
MSEQVVVTLITTIGGLVVAYFGYLGIRAGIAQAKKKRAGEPAVVDEDDERIISYENDPAKFVKDIMADNKAMREELRLMRGDQTKVWDEMRNLRNSLETQQRDETRFRDALGRWLIDLFAAWGKTPVMPWPRESDLETLKPVLPERT